MALKNMFRQQSKPVKELDDEELVEPGTAHTDVTRIADVQPRQEATVVGEITGLRVVPRRDGSQWLEATVTDGSGTVVAMWTGRRRIAGINPGQRLAITGRGSLSGPGGRLLILNPAYELL